MRELAGLLGWVTAWAFGLAIMNYFVKLINKKYINKLPKDKVNIINYYRTFMRLIIKNHKWFGIAALVALVTHFALVSRDPLPGILAGSFLGTVVLLGLYGSYINKNTKALWLKIHRGLAFALLIAVAIHITLI